MVKDIRKLGVDRLKNRLKKEKPTPDVGFIEISADRTAF